MYPNLLYQTVVCFYSLIGRTHAASFSQRNSSPRLFLGEQSSSALAVLPVGIFVDLDNVAPLTHSRADAQALAEPLQEFASRAGKLDSFQGFANRNTQTYVSDLELERRETEEQVWNREMSHTGIDANGILRCGICGARMKLSKKDRAKGWSMEDKLNKHMRMLHDREQTKRRNSPVRLKKKGRKKYRKYNSAQVGLSRGRRTKNDLFAILKEQGLRCHSADNVDSILIRSARKWMEGLGRTTTSEATETSAPLRGILVVVSKDSDFCELLKEAQSKQILGVSGTPEGEQTRKLVKASDITLTPPTYDMVIGEYDHLVPRACSDAGTDFLRDLEWPDDESLQLESMP